MTALFSSSHALATLNPDVLDSYYRIKPQKLTEAQDVVESSFFDLALGKNFVGFHDLGMIRS